MIQHSFKYFPDLKSSLEKKEPNTFKLAFHSEFIFDRGNVSSDTDSDKAEPDPADRGYLVLKKKWDAKMRRRKKRQERRNIALKREP